MRTLEPAKRTEPYVAGVNKSFPKEAFDSILMPGDLACLASSNRGSPLMRERLLKPTERNRTEAILASSCAMKWMFALRGLRKSCPEMTLALNCIIDSHLEKIHNLK
jgi:hypothetical protein